MTLTMTLGVNCGPTTPRLGGQDAPSAETSGTGKTITDASVRKVTRNEYEWRLLFAMCLLLWQLDSWSGVAFWIIERLFE